MLGLGKRGHPDGREGWEHAPGHCLGLSQLCFSRAQADSRQTGKQPFAQGVLAAYENTTSDC